jgi:integrase
MKFHSNIVFQKSKGRWRFQYPVPASLQRLAGAAWFTHGLTAIPEPEWKAYGTERAAFYDGLMDRLRALDAAQARELIALGGWKGMQAAVPADASFGLPGLSAWHVSAAAVTGAAWAQRTAESGVANEDPKALAAYVKAGKVRRKASAAVRVVAGLEAATNGATAANGNGTPILDLVRQWERVTEARRVEHQRKRVECALRLLVKVTGRTMAQDVTKDDARKFRDTRPRTDAGRKHLENVKACFRLACEDELIAADPFAVSGMVVKVPTKLEEEEKQAFEPAHIELIRAELAKLTASKHEAAKLIWRICFVSGMRSGEACRLTAADIVERDGVTCFHLRKTKDGSNRYVPIHGAILADVQARAANGGALFPNYADDAGVRRFQNRAAWLLREKCGIEDDRFSLHCTRHTMLSALADLRVDELTIAGISGHSTKKKGPGSLRRYTKAKATPREMLAAIHRLPEALIL